MFKKMLQPFIRETPYSRIVFERNGDQYGIPLGIFTINPDGSECVQIRPTGFAPEWSPDGKWIAFHDVPRGYESYASNIYIMSPNGKKVKQLTQHKGCAAACPTWSPDSKKIVYCIWEDQVHQICTVDIEDLRQKQLTYEGSNGYPVWTPSDEIVFQKENISPRQIYIMGSKGNKQRQFKIFQPGDDEPMWSRDGTKIVFARGEICVMNSDGANLQTVKTKGSVIEVSFSPDANRLVYSSTDEGCGQNIFVVNMDGSNEKRITKYSPGPHGKQVTSIDVCWSPWL